MQERVSGLASVSADRIELALRQLNTEPPTSEAVNIYSEMLKFNRNS